MRACRGTATAATATALSLLANAPRCWPQATPPCMQHAPCSATHVRTLAYVGELTPLAQEYHDSDFDFEEHARQMRPILDATLCLPSPPAQPPALQPRGITTTPSAVPAAPPSPLSPLSPVPAAPPCSGNEWDEFYKAHPRAKFFKERRYLLLEFPVLTTIQPPQHVVELGCGCGSAILPVLRANATARATVCDISQTSISQLLAAAEAAGVDRARVDAFAADAAARGLAARLHGLGADSVLIIFTLSAVLPQQQLDMLRNAYIALAPGGVFLIRDHGVFDMVQMRMKPGQQLGPNMYRLADGTVSYFFSVEDLQAKCQEVGFETVECKYVCVVNHNKKKNMMLKRVFVHGVFRKPLCADG